MRFFKAVILRQVWVWLAQAIWKSAFSYVLVTSQVGTAT